MSDGTWDRLMLSEEMKSSAEKLRNSSVLIVGSGALGSEIALKIAGCHVSKLSLVDGDMVSEANIPHSSIFRRKDVGESKIEVLAGFLIEKFPDLDVVRYKSFIQQCDQNVFDGHNLIICAPDNDQTRIWVNYYAVMKKTPAIFTGVSGPKTEWMGYAFVYKPGISACFNCFSFGGQNPKEKGISMEQTISSNNIEENRRKCGGENVPVPMIAPIIGVIASYTAVVSLRVLLNNESVPSYTYINLKKPNMMTTEIASVPTCAVCGKVIEYDVIEQLGQ